MSDRKAIPTLIGMKSGDHVLIEPNPKVVSGGFQAEITVRCGPWNGRYTAHFMVGELNKFGKDVEHVYNNEKCAAALKPLDPYLVMTLTGDGHGHIEVSGEARQKPGIKTGLEFHFEMEQEELKVAGRSLVLADPVG
jgi:hypothetical protein